MMTSQRARAHNAGFTMIEVMVAMVILVGLVSAVYISFVSVADTAEIARASTEELRIQQYLRDHFSNHLGSVHASISGEYAFIGEDDSGAYGPADTLTFVTTLPTSGAKSLPGIVKTVDYHIDDPSLSEEGGFLTFDTDVVEERESVTLFVTERPLALGEDDDEGLFEDDEEGLWEREIPIRSMNFEYYDGAQEEWVEAWNSDELGFLPWAVRVGVNLAKTEGQLQADLNDGVGTEEEPDLSLVVVLPTGAGVISEVEFIDPNHFRVNEEVDGGSDIFEEAR
jgi:prepilin-type N-terminal cleavage/methylation domain-containing protein